MGKENDPASLWGDWCILSRAFAVRFQSVYSKNSSRSSAGNYANCFFRYFFYPHPLKCFWRFFYHRIFFWRIKVIFPAILCLRDLFGMVTSDPFKGYSDNGKQTIWRCVSRYFLWTNGRFSIAMLDVRGSKPKVFPTQNQTITEGYCRLFSVWMNVDLPPKNKETHLPHQPSKRGSMLDSNITNQKWELNRRSHLVSHHTYISTTIFHGPLFQLNKNIIQTHPVLLKTNITTPSSYLIRPVMFEDCASNAHPPHLLCTHKVGPY